jgi:hypothetical protein
MFATKVASGKHATRPLSSSIIVCLKCFGKYIPISHQFSAKDALDSQWP